MCQTVVAFMANHTSYHSLLTIFGAVPLVQAPEAHLTILEKLNPVLWCKLAKFLAPREEVLFTTKVAIPAVNLFILLLVATQ